MQDTVFTQLSSKQAHLNYTLKYMDDLVKSGSKGQTFIFNADELKNVQKANPLQFKLVQPSKGLSSCPKVNLQLNYMIEGLMNK